MDNKSNLKPILITDFFVFVLLFLVYYFISEYTLLNSLIFSFLCTTFCLSLTIIANKYFKNKSDK